MTALLLAASLTGCGVDQDGVATDPGSSPSASTRPTAVPAASGQVYSRNLVTVVDTGLDTGGPELCLGAIAESYPPQCSGPAIAGWDWADQDLEQGDYSKAGSVRFGTFRVRGTWDGTTFGLASATPAALLDEVPLETPTPTLPPPSTRLSDDELADVADSLGRVLPGVQTLIPDDAGHVLADVIYDDGSLQRYVDDTYGVDVVLITSQLVDGDE